MTCNLKTQLPKTVCPHQLSLPTFKPIHPCFPSPASYINPPPHHNLLTSSLNSLSSFLPDSFQNPNRLSLGTLFLSLIIISLFSFENKLGHHCKHHCKHMYNKVSFFFNIFRMRVIYFICQFMLFLTLM